jgi:glycerate dehydrogenase
VLSQEPPKAGNPLLTAPRCFITPHIAWATLEARTRLMQMAVDNLRFFQQGEERNRV